MNGKGPGQRLIQVGDARFERGGPGVAVCVKTDTRGVTLLWLLEPQFAPTLAAGELEEMSRRWAAALTRAEPWESDG